MSTVVIRRGALFILCSVYNSEIFMCITIEFRVCFW